MRLETVEPSNLLLISIFLFVFAGWLNEVGIAA